MMKFTVPAVGIDIKSKKNIVLKEDGTFTIMTPVKTIFGYFEGTSKHVRECHKSLVFIKARLT